MERDQRRVENKTTLSSSSLFGGLAAAKHGERKEREMPGNRISYVFGHGNSAGSFCHDPGRGSLCFLLLLFFSFELGGLPPCHVGFLFLFPGALRSFRASLVAFLVMITMGPVWNNVGFFIRRGGESAVSLGFLFSFCRIGIPMGSGYWVGKACFVSLTRLFDVIARLFYSAAF